MLLSIADVLSAADVEEVRAGLATATFVDGKATAGWSARLVKSNLQASRGPFSARWQCLASSNGSTAPADSPRRAQAEASSIAADDDSPAFGGKVDAMTPRNPATGRPASRSTPAVPAM